MKSKTVTKAKPSSNPLPFKGMVETIMKKTDLTQEQIEKRMGISQGYLSRQMAFEANPALGRRPSKYMTKRLEMEFEFILTGRKTIELDQAELLNSLANNMNYALSLLNVLLTEVAAIQEPKNSSGRRQELTKTAKEGAEMMLKSM